VVKNGFSGMLHMHEATLSWQPRLSYVYMQPRQRVARQSELLGASFVQGRVVNPEEIAGAVVLTQVIVTPATPQAVSKALLQKE
jgi:hypothetical protein